jgi:hypothetical protein
MKKTVSGIAVMLLLTGMLMFSFNILPIKSAGAPNLTVFEPEINGSTASVNGVVFPGNPGTHIERIHWYWGDLIEEDHWFPASHTYTKGGNYTITVTAYQSDGLTSTATKKVALSHPERTILLLINENLYTSIKPSLTLFEQDLTNEGYSVVNATVSSTTSPPEIKNIIKSFYQTTGNLVGAILVGEIKAAYLEIFTGSTDPQTHEVSVYKSLDACDMYYMDLDGTWEHIANPDFEEDKPPNVAKCYKYSSCDTFINEYIVYLDEEEKEWNYSQIGNKNQFKAEIWVSRIMAHNLKIPGKGEAQIINEYFERNHNYRVAAKIASKAYMLAAWQESGSGAYQSMNFSGVFENITKADNVCKSSFLNCLGDPEGSKLFFLGAHSWPQGHALYDQSITTDELIRNNKTSAFYLLNACSSCRWDQSVSSPSNPNYLGGLYVFDTSPSRQNNGLGAIGFTGVGGFNWLNYFSDYLRAEADASFGDAYKHWFNSMLVQFMCCWPPGALNYVYLGDPTIGPQHPKEIVHDVLITGIKCYRTVLSNNTSTSINVTVQNQGTTAETFNVSLFYHENLQVNPYEIGTQTITLQARQSTILTFRWAAPGIGNCTLTAIASQIQGETRTDDNTLTFSLIRVSIPGDINADGKVNILDISIAAIAYQTKPGDVKWDANADVNEDGTINILDISAIAKEYGKSS